MPVWRTLPPYHSLEAKRARHERRLEAVGSRVGLGAVLQPPYRPALRCPLDTLER